MSLQQAFPVDPTLLIICGELDTWLCSLEAKKLIMHRIGEKVNCAKKLPKSPNALKIAQNAIFPQLGHTDEAREGIHRNCRNGLPVERAASRGTWVCRRRVRRQGFDARNVEASVLTPSENYVNLCRLLRRLS